MVKFARPTYSQPPVPADKVAQIEMLTARGDMTPQQIGNATGVSRKSVEKYADIARAAGRIPPKGTKLPSSATGPSPASQSRAGVVGEADYFVSTPKAFMMDSRIVNMAMEAARTEWRWPEMPPGDFIDTVLFLYFRDRRIVLSSYVKLGQGDELVLPEVRIRRDGAGQNGATPVGKAAPEEPEEEPEKGES